MNAPPQALTALLWALVGPPLILYAATRPRRGRFRQHAALMIAWIAIELAVFASFGFVDPSPRRPALQATAIFRIHLALAITTLVGMSWQVVSRAIPTLRPVHRRTGPVVAAAWCLALLTGIYNFVFLYIRGGP